MVTFVLLVLRSYFHVVSQVSEYVNLTTIFSSVTWAKIRFFSVYKVIFQWSVLIKLRRIWMNGADVKSCMNSFAWLVGSFCFGYLMNSGSD